MLCFWLFSQLICWNSNIFYFPLLLDSNGLSRGSPIYQTWGFCHPFLPKCALTWTKHPTNSIWWNTCGISAPLVPTNLLEITRRVPSNFGRCGPRNRPALDIPCLFLMEKSPWVTLKKLGGSNGFGRYYLLVDLCLRGPLVLEKESKSMRLLLFSDCFNGIFVE